MKKWVFMIGISVVILLISLCGCTLSFQNISTHGTASDVVDENQEASTDIKTTIPTI